MYTIFSDGTPIYLTDDLKFKLNNNFFYYDQFVLADIIKSIESGDLKETYIYHPDLLNLWKSFKNHFHIEIAAGGLVRNDSEENLFIFRLNRWDLPKGKIENGESKKEAAVREVMEECGLKHVVILGKLMKTYHLFTRDEKQVLKITHWYNMHTSQEDDLTPQIEEDISKVAFMDSLQTKKALENTYGNIKLLFQCLEDN